MPNPCPTLHEILALEAKIRGDKYDLTPQALYKDPIMGDAALRVEAKLLHGVVYRR